MGKTSITFTGYRGETVTKEFDLTDPQALFLFQFTDALVDAAQTVAESKVVPFGVSAGLETRIAAVIAMDAFTPIAPSSLKMIANVRRYIVS